MKDSNSYTLLAALGLIFLMAGVSFNLYKKNLKLKDRVFELEERVISISDTSLDLCDKYKCSDQELEILLQISDPDHYFKESLR